MYVKHDLVIPEYYSVTKVTQSLNMKFESICGLDEGCLRQYWLMLLILSKKATQAPPHGPPAGPFGQVEPAAVSTAKRQKTVYVWFDSHESKRGHAEAAGRHTFTCTAGTAVGRTCSAVCSRRSQMC